MLLRRRTSFLSTCQEDTTSHKRFFLVESLSAAGVKVVPQCLAFDKQLVSALVLGFAKREHELF